MNERRVKSVCGGAPEKRKPPNRIQERAYFSTFEWCNCVWRRLLASADSGGILRY